MYLWVVLPHNSARIARNGYVTGCCNAFLALPYKEPKVIIMKLAILRKTSAKSKMRFFALFCLALLLHYATCAEVEAPSPAEDGQVIIEENEKHSAPGFDITFIGRGPKIQLTPTGQNTSFLRVDFGSVYEVDEAGKKVNGRVIESLAAQKPDMSLGVENINGTNVTFVLMELELPNVKGTSFDYSACTAIVAEDYFNDGGAIKTKVYFGFEEDFIFPYGLHNSLLVPANSTKLSVEVIYWPFCDVKNTMKLELTVKTGAGKDAKPIISSLTESEDGEVASDSRPTSIAGGAVNGASSGTPANTTSGINRHRKMLANTADLAVVKAVDNSNTDGNSSNVELEVGHASSIKQAKKAKKDPRVVGSRKDKIALLTAPGKAAILDFPTYAYDDVNSDKLINITTEVSEHGDHMMVTLGFPGSENFVYYDPTMQVGVYATDAGYTAAEAANVTTAEEPVTTATAKITNTTSTVGDKKNAADLHKVNFLSTLAVAGALLAALV